MGADGGHGRPDRAECLLDGTAVNVVEKTGTTFTSIVHILTTMLGLGVLSLPSALGALGWVAGGLLMILFYISTSMSSLWLVKIYEVDGVQHPRYYDAVANLLGPRWKMAAGVTQLSNIAMTCIAYVITSGTCLKTIASIACGLSVGTGTPETGGVDGCVNYQWLMTTFFGIWMVFVCQMRDIESSWVVSTVGASASFTFSFIAVGLCIDRMAGGEVYGTVGGVLYASTADKVFNVMNALGTIGFAFGFVYVQLEIHDTVKEPSRPRMRSAVRIACTVALGLYSLVAVCGYMAFGDAVPSMLLEGFTGPSWLLIVVNAIVLVDMTSSFNIFSQAVFLSLEEWVAARLGLHHPAEVAVLAAADDAWAAEELEEDSVKPTAGSEQAAHGGGALPRALSSAVLGTRTLRRVPTGERHATAPAADQPHMQTVPSGCMLTAIASRKDRRVMCIAGPLRMTSALRCSNTPEIMARPARVWAARSVSFLIRAIYVVIITTIGVFVPFFGSIAGLIGAIAYWPLQILFPSFMLMAAYELPRWQKQGLYALNVVMALVSIAAAIGSCRNIITGWEGFSLV